jgi:glycosyltransferase involved in cell wall biosynthesis
VGRLTRDKGLPELIAAFELILEECPTAYLLLAGWFDKSDDALTSEMRGRIDRHPRITCTGYVEDAAPFYRAMDIFILPTRREGFPNAVLEASSTGIPVITTFATGARDSVVPGVTGLLIAPGDAKAICAASLELIRDPERRQRMGAAGRAWVTGSFEQRRVLGQVVRFYQGLMSRRGERTRIGDSAEA